MLMCLCENCVRRTEWKEEEEKRKVLQIPNNKTFINADDFMLHSTQHIILIQKLKISCNQKKYIKTVTTSNNSNKKRQIFLKVKKRRDTDKNYSTLFYWFYDSIIATKHKTSLYPFSSSMIILISLFNWQSDGKRNTNELLLTSSFDWQDSLDDTGIDSEKKERQMKWRWGFERTMKNKEDSN